MKLSISNLAWNSNDDRKVFSYLREKGFCGVEIAPTKLFGDRPYEHMEEAARYFSDMKDDFGLEVSSLQSIWYGREGNIFASEEERNRLRDYSFSAVDFASAIKCGNLVFGNPKARNKSEKNRDDEVFEFFRQISDYAYTHGTCFSLEPNPVIYNTNFINSTEEAFSFCRVSGCKHLRVNVDLGAVIYNGETLDCIRENIDMVNHIHISEPYLKKIEKRDIHFALKELDYDRYCSIEMGLQNSLQDVFDVVDYICGVFNK